MAKLVIETRENNAGLEVVNVYDGYRRWRRTERHHDVPCWKRLNVDSEERHVSKKKAKTLEKMYRHARKHKQKRQIQRFPRTTILDISEIPLTTQIEGVEDRWLVDRLIPATSLVLLAAPPGSFKTWFALILADAISRGSDFIGRGTLQAKVLYLDRENPLRVIGERRKILHLNEGNSFKIWGHWLADAPPEIGDPRLLEIARHDRPLMIFDSFLRFHTAQENSATEMARIIGELRQFTDAGATVLLLHHQAKSESSRYRGSTDILAGVDVAFALSKRRVKGQTILSLECFKHRFLEEFKLTLRPDLANGRFGNMGDPSEGEAGTIIGKLQEIIEQSPGITQSELILKSDCGQNRVRDVLHDGKEKFWTVKRGRRKTLRYYPVKE